MYFLKAGFKENNFDYVGMIDVDFYFELLNDITDELTKHMSTNNHDITQIIREEYLTKKKILSLLVQIYFIYYTTL